MKLKFIIASITITAIAVIIIVNKNRSINNESLKKNNNYVSYEGEYAQYSCIVLDNDEYVKSWDIGLIKKEGVIYLMDASFAIWLKKQAKYSFELEPETFTIPISKGKCELELNNEDMTYKLIGSFKHTGKFKEYKGKLLFNGKYIELEKEKIISERMLKINCLPSEL